MKRKIKSAVVQVAIKAREFVLNQTGLQITYTKVKDDTDQYIRLYGEESVKNRRFYNICAGGHGGFGGFFYHPCWTNIDVINPNRLKNWIEYRPDIDIAHDLMDCQPLPLESNSAEIIQSQYTIEHIPNEAARVFFKEVFRSLKSKGIFKVVAPNIELDYQAYQNGDWSYFSWIHTQSRKEYLPIYGYGIPLNQASLEQIALAHFAANASTIHIGTNPQRIDDQEFQRVMSSMKMEDAYDYCTSRCSEDVQKTFRANHINWWNHQKLISALKDAGFKKVYIVAPGQSSSPVLRNRNYFDNMWNEVALFIEAIKE